MQKYIYFYIFTGTFYTCKMSVESYSTLLTTPPPLPPYNTLGSPLHVLKGYISSHFVHLSCIVHSWKVQTYNWRPTGLVAHRSIIVLCH
jgi:hypothetical protein